MLLQFTLLSVYSVKMLFILTSYCINTHIRRALSHLKSLIIVLRSCKWASDCRVQLLLWASEWVCVLFGWCSSLHYFYLLVHVFCCYLFVVLCLFVLVAVAASLFFHLLECRAFRSIFFSIQFRNTNGRKRNHCAVERNPLWLLVAEENMCAHSRALSLSLSHSLFLLRLSLLFVLLLFVRWIFIVN